LVIAARGEFRTGIATATLFAAFVLAAGTLLTRFLRRPRLNSTGGVKAWAIELPCWTAVGGVALIVSKIHLATGYERWGALSLFFLGSTLLSSPVVFSRSTALEDRLARWPSGLTLGTLLALLAFSAFAALKFFTTPPSFI
jgi:hypothetical protein